MKEISLALIGKDIQKSKSPELYEKLYPGKVNYELIDINNESDLPSLIELREKFHGISITTPYKKSYLDDVNLIGEYSSAINAIDVQSVEFKATNTDYLALKKIIDNMSIQSPIVILGDGTMSELLAKILKKCPTTILSRRNKKLYDSDKYLSEPSIVINTCLREYEFKTSIPENVTLFWSLNYSVSSEKAYMKENNIPYMDGIELLELQAKYALEFWDLYKF